VSEDVWIKRMGDSVGKVYKIAEDTTTAYGWPDGRPMYHTMMEGSQ
jgi:hypothetical protein